jgi:hypothetical protein
MARTTRVCTLKPSTMLQFSTVLLGHCTHRHDLEIATGLHAPHPTHEPWIHHPLLPWRSPHGQSTPMEFLQAFYAVYLVLATACFGLCLTLTLAPRKALKIQMLPQTSHQETAKGHCCGFINNGNFARLCAFTYHSSVRKCQRSVALVTSQHLTQYETR